jgi:hypothetical protein
MAGQNPDTTNDGTNNAEQYKRSPESNPPLPAPATPIAKAECCKADKNKTNWTEIFAFIAALGGIAAAIAGGYQGWIARDTEIVSSGALVISNSMRFSSYESPTDPNRKWQISDVLANVGNTPTRHLKFIPGLGICWMGPPAQIGVVNDPFPWRNANKTLYSRTLIGPKSDVDGATLTGVNVKINCPTAITSRGVIKYEDIFGYPHITEFCHYIESIDDFKNFPAGQIVSAGARPCQNEHNCVDEECGQDWKERAKE